MRTVIKKSAFAFSKNSSINFTNTETIVSYNMLNFHLFFKSFIRKMIWFESEVLEHFIPTPPVYTMNTQRFVHAVSHFDSIRFERQHHWDWRAYMSTRDGFLRYAALRSIPVAPDRNQRPWHIFLGRNKLGRNLLYGRIDQSSARLSSTEEWCTISIYAWVEELMFQTIR